ncbi:MAG TPA: serine/threonine-protein kinase, partial [Gemmatimonadales bacterium]
MSDVPENSATAPAPVGADQLLERLRAATIGEYDLYGELGRGGMATVYLAHELALDRKVAIKVMAPALTYGPGMSERFKREARTAAQLSHPNIIPVYAVREAGELLFFIMKLVEGTPLDSIMRELGKLPIPMVEAILAQVGGAIGYAHRRGVVHRDIKPSNILIDEEGWAVVTDFGIAKVQETEALTQTGTAVGTPTYMSPEQCGGGVLDGRSDQYSLGVVAYEMLTGKPPFAGSMMALMYSHFHEAVPPITQLRPDCPPVLEAAVMRMLEKDPALRWPSLEEAVAALGARHLAHDDPTRDQLILLARSGTTHKIVSQVQTPRSPIPLAQSRRTTAPV